MIKNKGSEKKMRYEIANDGYGICKNCERYQHLDNGMCFECRVDQMTKNNKRKEAKKGGKTC